MFSDPCMLLSVFYVILSCVFSFVIYLQLGYTALHRAAAQGHLEVVHVLCDEGCALDRQDEVVMCLPITCTRDVGLRCS